MLTFFRKIKFGISRALWLGIPILFLLFAMPAHGQVDVTGLTNGSSLQCLVSSVDNDGINVAPNIPVPIFISPNNNVYAIKGTYNLAIQAGDGEYASVSAVDNAVLSAVAQANAISGFPQHVTGDSNNLITIKVGHFGGQECGARDDGSLASACEENTFLPQANGDNLVHATIYIDEDANDPAPSLILSNPNILQSVISHEMGHAFGLGDTYAFEEGLGGISLPGIMGDDVVNNYNNPNLPPTTWDASAIAVVQALNSLSSIALNPTSICINRTACDAPGEISFFSQNSEGYYQDDCSSPYAVSCVENPGGSCDVDAGTDCVCSPSDGSAPYCVNPSGKFVSAAGFCSSANNSSASPSPSGTGSTDGCSCTSSGGQCYDADGNAISAPTNWCSAGVVPANEVCSCANGTAFCSDSNGTDVQVPSGFSCQSGSGSTVTGGGYNCIDDACVYNPDSWTYSDIGSCQEVCGSGSD